MFEICLKPYHAVSSPHRVADFCWDEKNHGTPETFLIMVENVDGEIILFHNSFVLHQQSAEDEHNITLPVPTFEPVPPNYYISVISDRRLHAETHLPIPFKPAYLAIAEYSPAKPIIIFVSSRPESVPFRR
jgi:pre-mRNA-splicing helicase BRR2